VVGVLHCVFYKRNHYMMLLICLDVVEDVKINGRVSNLAHVYGYAIKRKILRNVYY